LITDELPHSSPSPLGEGRGEGRISNSDPVTGQAGWYDVRVRIRRAEAGEPKLTAPTFAPMPALPGTRQRIVSWIAYAAGKAKR